MRPETAKVRRLRFDLEMAPDESIPGAVARGVRRHVLVRTAPMLEAAGVRLRHLGMSQLASPEELARLAHVARCPPDEFVARAGQRVFGPNGGKSLDAQFGSLVMPRAYLELDVRRIGPTTLRTSGHHRLDWMNLLLPYCPVSLERLIDRCGPCDSRLGWRYARGVGCCDLCGQELDPSTEAGLTDAVADDYRLFARLSSPDGRAVEQALGELPASLAQVAPSALVRTALLVGGLVTGETATSSRHRVADLPPPVLAEVATRGTAMLRRWPDALRRWVAERSEDLAEDVESLERLRARLHRFVDSNAEPPEVVALIHSALPDLGRHAAHGFSANRRYYLYKGVQNLLGLSSPRMAALKEWPGIAFRRLNTAEGKQQGQFDVDQIDGLIPVFRDTVAMNACASRFRLRLYAVEQCCAAGVLEREDHPALLATGVHDRIRGSSLRALEALLARKAQKLRDDNAPADCVALSSASRSIGGRLKPWGAIVDALGSGRLPFWIVGTATTTATIKVRPGDLARFQRISGTWPPTDSVDGADGDCINQLDAAEVLNIATGRLSELAGSLRLPFERCGSSLTTSMSRVLAVAAEIAWSPEIALHLGVHTGKVEGTLDEMGVPSVHGGWPQAELVARGALPRAPRNP